LRPSRQSCFLLLSRSPPHRDLHSFPTRRSSDLSRPSTGNSAPTPKSNPSRTKYPDHNTAMRTNQTVDNSIVLPLFGSSYPLRAQYVKTNGSSSARSFGSNERPSYGSGPARAYRISNRISMTAKTPYRTVNRLIDIKTSAVVVPGDTPVRVVIIPNTSHGWRPISVNIQPKELASSGKKATVTAAHHQSLCAMGLRR